MRTTSKTFSRACDILRSRVRFETAHLRLPSSQILAANDTPVIREATRLYVETWIVPLIDAMQDGEVADVKELLP
jgi:hypothetical protein